MTQPTYTLDQRTFCLCALSNLSSNYKASSEQNVASEITQPTATDVNAVLNDPTVQGQIGSWRCVWGPVVVAHEETPSGKDPYWATINTMFIAQSASEPDTYVVSIAGTNPDSTFDWKQEDFDVNKKVTWPKGTYLFPPKISEATHYGLNVLMNMQDGGKTALQYLQGIDGNRHITVTGHSLGGALSPCFALYLYDEMGAGDQDSPVTVACMPLAGATPGNEAFAKHYDEKMGDATNRVWNGLDIVPHAWGLLGKLPKLYASYPLPSDTPLYYVQYHFLGTHVKPITFAEALLLIDTYAYWQIRRDTPAFSSEEYTLNEANIPQPPPPPEHPKPGPAPLTRDEQLFFIQAILQHINGYVDHFGVRDFTTHVAKIVHQKAFFQAQIPSDWVDG